MSLTPGGQAQLPSSQGQLAATGLPMPGIQTPAPVPVGQGGGMQMMPMQSPGGGASISLGLLLEYLVQKTYHELSILAELLPRKMDMEKKIEIVKFARSTRQSFIRLLALVKWAGSAAKVDKCAAISSFLDQQSLLFVDTADRLSRMARENLVHARLPNFCLPHAVDVLTMRQYKRMPACIKERIVPPDPITSSEKETVLHRLDQIIQHRLVTSELPPQLANLTIEDGRVKFRVPQEFEVTLTLMEDNKTIPWRLLNIEVLVQDPDTGDGKALVHPLQVNYIHQLVQSRLFGDDKPLVDMYNVLHTFCQSLQLEVLNSQAQRLINARWGEHVMIDKYTAGESLLISYWRSQSLHTSPEFFKLSVSIDDNDVAKPLQVSHDPPLEMADASRVSRAIRCDNLSVERLLVETILIRSRLKLKELKGQLEKDLPGFKTEVEGTPSLLCMPVVKPCNPDERLIVSVDMQTGCYAPSIAHCDAGLLDEIEHSLNYDGTKLEPLITKLRTMLYMRHCRYSVAMLPVTFLKELPLLTVSPDHPIKRLLPNQVYLRLTHHPQYYVVVDFKVGSSIGDFQSRYHLLHCTPVSYSDPQAAPTGGATPSSQKDSGEADTAKTYLTPNAFVDLNSATILRGPDTSAEDIESDSDKKRKSHSDDAWTGRKRKAVSSCEFFNHTLSHVVSLCNIRIPFIKLCEELSQNGLAHQGIQVEGEGVGLVVKLCDLPLCNKVTDETSEALKAALLDCSYRLHKNQHGMWQVQLVFANCPVTSCSSREQGATRLVYLHYKVLGSHSVVKQFLRDWDSIGQLYQLTMVLPIYLPYLTLSHSSRSSLIQDNPPFTTLVDIQSFTYQKITIAYGKDRASTVTVYWDPDSQKFRLLFGGVGSTSTANCHTTVQQYLEQELNEDKNLPKLIKTLCESQGPLHAICKLPLIPSLGLLAQANQNPSPLHKFALVAQSSTHYRVAFHSAYCLDIQCKSKNTVAIKDGAYSLFDIRKGVEGFYPVANLKAFLELFIDEAVSYHQQHRNSRTLHANDDDPNPLSPMNIDSGPTPPDPYLPSQVASAYPPGASPMSRTGLGQGGSGGFAYPMTPPTAPGGPGSSNPATPASPHVLSQQQYTMSPGAYPLASPPSIPGPSPSAVMKGTPSPGITDSGSPYPPMGLAMPSPGSRQWPGSPSMPGPSPVQRFGMAQSPGSMGATTHSPGSSGVTGQQGQVVSRQSRILPARNIMSSTPTILSHDALNRMFTPAAIPGTPASPNTYLCAPIERFLGLTYLQKHVQRAIRNDQSIPAAEQSFRQKLTILHPSDQGINFKHDYLIFRVWLNPAHMQQLHLQVMQSPDAKDRFSPDELQMVERYFENKVACPPFKPKAITAFVRMLSANPNVFRDLIKLMHLELQPDPAHKWTLQICLTVPHSGNNFFTVGIPAVVIKSKMLLFVQLTRQDMPGGVGGQQQEAGSVIVPILYDIQANSIQHLAARSNNLPTSQTDATVVNMFRKWAEFASGTECTLFPAIRDLLANLILPM